MHQVITLCSLSWGRRSWHIRTSRKGSSVVGPSLFLAYILVQSLSTFVTVFFAQFFILFLVPNFPAYSFAQVLATSLAYSHSYFMLLYLHTFKTVTLLHFTYLLHKLFGTFAYFLPSSLLIFSTLPCLRLCQFSFAYFLATCTCFVYSLFISLLLSSHIFPSSLLLFL